MKTFAGGASQTLFSCWRPCPLCLSSDSVPVGQRPDGAWVVRCGGCRLAYLNPQPPLQAVRHFYNREFFELGSYRGEYHRTHGAQSSVWS